MLVMPFISVTIPFVVLMPCVAVLVTIPLLKVLLAPVHTFVEASSEVAAAVPALKR